MSTLITLEQVDADGAVRDAAEAAGVGRREMLRRSAIAGGSFVAGGVLFGGLVSPAQAAISSRKKSKVNDAKILNYALTLEYLEAEFYKQALANNAFSSEAFKLFATTVYAHEASHVKTLKSVLGSAAVKKPTFDFADAVTDAAKFAATAQVLEDTGVSAYAGQGPNILQRAVVSAALSIHSVEARHAAWIRFLNMGSNPSTSALPAPRDFDKPAMESTVLGKVKGTGFIPALG